MYKRQALGRNAGWTTAAAALAREQEGDAPQMCIRDRRCLNLLEQPTKGTITFDGTVITDPKVNIDAIRRQMGMVFQHFNLFPNMTIRKNITLAPVKTKLMGQEEADALALSLSLIHISRKDTGSL